MVGKKSVAEFASVQAWQKCASRAHTVSAAKGGACEDPSEI